MPIVFVMGGPRGSGPGSVFAFLVNLRNIEVHFEYEHYFVHGWEMALHSL